MASTVIRCDAGAGVGVAATGDRLAQHLRDAQREEVLARGVGAVQRLDGVDELKHRHALRRLLGRHREGLLALLAEVDGVEPVPEGVGDDHVAAQVVEHASQVFGAADAGDVLRQPDDDHVPEVGRDLHAVVDEERRVRRAVLIQLVSVPQAIVFGDVQSGQAALVRLLREIFRAEAAVRCPCCRVDVHVEDGPGHIAAL